MPCLMSRTPTVYQLPWQHPPAGYRVPRQRQWSSVKAASRWRNVASADTSCWSTMILSPSFWLLLHGACTKYIITKKKEKNIQNTERSGDVDVRDQAGIEASLLCIQTGFTCEQNNLGYLHHRLISCWFRIAPLAVLWTLCCRWRRCLEPLWSPETAAITGHHLPRRRPFHRVVLTETGMSKTQA